MTDVTDVTDVKATETENNSDQIAAAIRKRYAGVALQVTGGQTGDCCGPTASTGCCDTAPEAAGTTISQGLYATDELEGLPLKAALASLGCGNPTALTELHPGETVLDLGSGGGIDVLLSARRVGPTGLAYGLDMLDEMLELAQRNAAEAGVENVRWLKGDIAHIPLPDNSVDVIISNCVINLAADKLPVFQEAYRVLKPGGRFAVSDIVIHGGLPVDLIDSAELRRDLSSWSGCIAGALTDSEYRAGLAQAGFTSIDLEMTRRYTLADAGHAMPDMLRAMREEQAEAIVSRFASTFVRARKG